MIDVTLDGTEIQLRPERYCGHCIVEMKLISSNIVECPVCNAQYKLEDEKK